MNIKNFTHKKIGIWGFGVVGKSAYDFIKKIPCFIQILDKQKQDLPEWIAQDEISTIKFLEHNDIIIASPGIPLHNFTQFHHKFISELDIFNQIFKGKTIAITGTLGKTSITNVINHCVPESVAAGNIGNPMITAAQKQPKTISLEVSSFQLQYIKNFAPDIALWTNFYPNHLDHHVNEEEYFAAKCNIFKYQTNIQYAIMPCSIVNRVTQIIDIKSQVLITCNQDCNTHTYPTFILKNNNIVLRTNNSQETTIFEDVTTLPTYTYQENWLQIIATLYVKKIDLKNLVQTVSSISNQENRLEKIATYKNCSIYNDSKSTVWQATKQALQSIGNEPCALFLGGVGKGTDRSPLIAYLQNKPITVFAFGKEAPLLQDLCNKYAVICFSYANLEQAVQDCFNKPLPKNILFSPAGASFDLFKNYQERGSIFKKLITEKIQKL